MRVANWQMNAQVRSWRLFLHLLF